MAGKRKSKTKLPKEEKSTITTGVETSLSPVDSSIATTSGVVTRHQAQKILLTHTPSLNSEPCSSKTNRKRPQEEKLKTHAIKMRKTKNDSSSMEQFSREECLEMESDDDQISINKLPIVTQTSNVNESATVKQDSSTNNLHSTSLQGSSSSSSHKVSSTFPPRLPSTTPFDSAYNADEIRNLLMGRGVPSELLNHPRMQNAIFHEYVGYNATSTVNQLVGQLSSCTNDPDTTFALLTEINQHLLVAGEDGVLQVRFRELVNVFKPILGSDFFSEESKTMCLNVFSHIMDSCPQASDYIIHVLKEIIDVAQSCCMGEIFERVIHCVELLSRRQGATVLQQNCINKLLPVFEFLTSSQLRSALHLVQNCVLSISSGKDLEKIYHSNLHECVRFLISRGLKISDKECVEISCSILQILITICDGQEQLYSFIVTDELFRNLQALLLSSSPIFGSSDLVIRLLSDICHHSPVFVLDLMKIDISKTLAHVMHGSHSPDQLGGPRFSQSHTLHSHDEVYEAVNLIAEMMPPLPLCTSRKPLYLYGRPVNRVNNSSSSSNASKPTNSNSTTSDEAKRHDAHHFTTPNNSNKIITQWYYRLPNSICYVPFPSNLSNQIEENLSPHKGKFTGSDRKIHIPDKCSTDVTYRQKYLTELVGYPLVLHLPKRKMIGSKATATLHRFPPSSAEQNCKICDRQSLIKLLDDDLEGLIGSNKECLSNCELVRQCVSTFYPLVVDICIESGSIDVKVKAIEALLRLICYLPAPMVQSLQNVRSLSLLAIDLFSNQDNNVIVGAVHLTQMFLDKLPTIACLRFKKEGVLHKMKSLLQTFDHDLSAKLEKETDLSLNEIVSSESTKPSSSSRVSNILPFRRRTRRGQNLLSHHTPLSSSESGAPSPATISAINEDQASSSSNSHSRIPTINNTSSSSHHDHGRFSALRMMMQNLRSSLSYSGAVSPFTHRGQVKDNSHDIQELKWLKDQLSKLCNKLEENQKNDFVGSTQNEGNSLSLSLREHCEKLKEMASTSSTFSQTEKKETLKNIANILCQTLSTDISPFELVQCGLVPSLLSFLTCTTPDQINNIRAFVKIFLSRNENGIIENDCQETAVISTLIGKLLACLHHQEQFQVLSAPLPFRQSRGGPSSSLSLLGNQTAANSQSNEANFFRQTRDSNTSEPYIPRLRCILKPLHTDNADNHPLKAQGSSSSSSHNERKRKSHEESVTTSAAISVSQLSQHPMIGISPLTLVKELAVVVHRLCLRRGILRGIGGLDLTFSSSDLYSGDDGTTDSSGDSSDDVEVDQRKRHSHHSINESELYETGSHDYGHEYTEEEDTAISTDDDDSIIYSTFDNISEEESTMDEVVKPRVPPRSKVGLSIGSSSGGTTNATSASTDQTGSSTSVTIGNSSDSATVTLANTNSAEKNKSPKPPTKHASKPSIVIYFQNQKLPSDITLYEAVMRPSTTNASNTSGNNDEQNMETNIWNHVHTFEYSVTMESSNVQHKKMDSLNSSRRSSRTAGTSSSMSQSCDALLNGWPDCDLIPVLTNGSSSSTVLSNTNDNNTKDHKSRSRRSRKMKPDDELLKKPLAVTLMSQTLSSDSVKEIQGEVAETLTLLSVLHSLNRFWYTLFNLPDTRPVIAESTFVSAKLTTKATRQLQSYFTVMTNTLPAWLIYLMYHCSYLFSFETRRNFFYLYRGDRDRCQAHLQTMGVFNETEGAHIGGRHLSRSIYHRNHTDSRGSSRVLHRSDSIRTHSSNIQQKIPKTRINVTRGSSLLPQALTNIRPMLSTSGMLEVQFAGEVGFGLGPTQEFYTLLSRELMRADLNLWHHNGITTVKQNLSTGEDESVSIDFVIAHLPGLFPSPMCKNTHDSSIIQNFHFIGALLGRAILDQRQLDLPLSPLVFRVILGQKTTLTGADLVLVDPQLCRQLHELSAIAAQAKRIKTQMKPGCQESALVALGIEEMYLTFTLPGYDNIELIRKGHSTLVTPDNIDHYLQLVVSYYLRDGVYRQFNAMIEGFDSVISSSRLAVFQPEELETFACGYGVKSNEDEYWQPNSLMKACKLEHGYNCDSPAIHHLFDIMSEFSHEERRLFLQFITGSPRLPQGGFQSLRPPLTIVPKKETDCAVDDQLPSVMTCQSFLKLPNYISRAKMKEKLLLAIEEGQQAFLLS